ncbi:hypothetical protein A3G53_01135 [Candidatus Nomurabacteria bacterium RIFCSPLOWO2_12_FULL_44_11]|uniref:Uncharacterized protein n=1 Tax=Candidatus Nomurabacteria bacterium RIFCSPLOWO2_12_FULL_44_11 TaxID=1801796 RepID=A0A1F6Y7Z4_9BACT|nr:MAG: hypothetical protein A3E95_01780 [Candidatus Nomurabacteria bacterium RIFCSPHIGHO2_12_FULL_44_22b]OGJ02483.1 MAG: hypothetical protein A3G53_01135 [Candidatus Nomurabacteria bacterium RIFCSPLOWO2_12_FULL_44_11]
MSSSGELPGGWRYKWHMLATITFAGAVIAAAIDFLRRIRIKLPSGWYLYPVAWVGLWVINGIDFITRPFRAENNQPWPMWFTVVVAIVFFLLALLGGGAMPLG